MPELRLPRLPDRTPVKISISISPDLYTALAAYADAYQTAYGIAENIADLIPYMLAAFIESDSSFKKGRRGRDTESKSTERSPQKARHSGLATSSKVPSPDSMGGG